MDEIIRILKNYKLVKSPFYIYIICGFFLESLYVTFPYLTKQVYKLIEESASIQEYINFLIFLFIFTSIVLMFSFVWEYFGHKTWLSLHPKLTDKYRRKLFEKNYSVITDNGTGKLIVKIRSGTDAEVDIFLKTIQIFINAGFRGLLVIIIIGYYLPSFLPVVIFAIIILFIVNYYMRKYVNPIIEKEQKIWEEDGRNGARIIMENFTIRYFGKQEKELEKAYKNNKKVVNYGLKVDAVNLAYYKVLEYLLRILEIVIFLIVGIAILKSQAYELSYLVMLSLYVWFLWWPLDKAVDGMNHINKVWSKYKSLQDFLDTENKVVNGKKHYIYKTGLISLQNINFNYDDTKNIFTNFSLDFLAGKKNALIGHSGSGKSTIVKLLLRLYNVGDGNIIIDGQNIKDLDINTLYNNIGYLAQEASIFDGTIRDNLDYAFNADKINYLQDNDKFIWESLKKASIDEMVRGLKKGLDTEVGEKGIKLSGGEKQRLAIARIFLKNPSIIILDEPTSALDSISEILITKSLDLLMKGKTSIIIAHRLQTVMRSDKIIILENGKIESEGTHKGLLKKSRVYKTSIDLQNGQLIE